MWLTSAAVLGLLFGYAAWGLPSPPPKQEAPVAMEATKATAPKAEPKATGKEAVASKAENDRAPSPPAPKPAPAPEPATALPPKPTASEVPAGAEPDENEPSEEPEVSTPVAAEPTPAPASKAELSGAACRLQVVTRPDGAQVLLAGRELGTTPLEQEVPCGEAEVDIRRPRYVDVHRSVHLNPESPATLDVHLTRPTYHIRVLVRPGNASVTINGRTVGTSPLTTQVQGYEQASIRIVKPGYQTWSKRVYASKDLTVLKVALKAAK
jgi:hypothetical protein